LAERLALGSESMRRLAFVALMLSATTGSAKEKKQADLDECAVLATVLEGHAALAVMDEAIAADEFLVMSVARSLRLSPIAPDDMIRRPLAPLSKLCGALAVENVLRDDVVALRSGHGIGDFVKRHPAIREVAILSRAGIDREAGAAFVLVTWLRITSASDTVHAEDERNEAIRLERTGPRWRIAQRKDLDAE
jgi:hypothetical protein